MLCCSKAKPLPKEAGWQMGACLCPGCSTSSPAPCQCLRKVVGNSLRVCIPAAVRMLALAWPSSDTDSHLGSEQWMEKFSLYLSLFPSLSVTLLNIYIYILYWKSPCERVLTKLPHSLFFLCIVWISNEENGCPGLVSYNELCALLIRHQDWPSGFELLLSFGFLSFTPFVTFSPLLFPFFSWM